MRREVLALVAVAVLAVPAWAHQEDPKAARFVPITIDVPLPETTPDAVVEPLPVEPAPPELAPPPEIRTSWGFGARENLYNETIVEAVLTAWPHEEIPLPPTLFKSVIAAESSFDAQAVSATGAAGLVQLTPDTARRFGLTSSGRYDPDQAVPAGVQALAEKAKAIVDPANYHLLLGRQPEDCPYAQKVAQAYDELGPPTDEQYWPLMLAAYNGGGGTVLRAMAIAYDRGLDPRKWENLVGDRSKPKGTPLFAACVEIYKWGAAGKYREMSRYPDKVMKFYREAGEAGLSGSKHRSTDTP